MNVSVIIAAHNAEDTIADTLESLLNQTFPHWEAIVVDDGSNDDAENVVKSFVERDARFRFLKQQQMGVSIARNNGIKLARFDWLVFLDSDDWILPFHLERLTRLLDADPSLDVAYCGWAYVTPDGEQVFKEFYGTVGDLFLEHTECCVSAIHSYIVRRSLVEAVGGFDPSMLTCEDWDLWQRIARTGARFGGIGEILAAYRMRSGSVTCNGHQLLKDGIRVLNQGHAPDPRVPKPHPVYPEGLPKEQLAENKFYLLSASAGYVIGRGSDARPLLEELKDEHCSTLNPNRIAACIFKHAMVSASRSRREWYKIWLTIEGNLENFLVALEAHSGTPGLARRARGFTKHMMMKHAKDPGLTRRIGSLQARLILRIYEFTEQVYGAGQFFKRFILAALLMAPKLKRLIRDIKHFFRPKKTLQMSGKKVSTQIGYKTTRVVKSTQHALPAEGVPERVRRSIKDELPILLYGRIGPIMPDTQKPLRVAPETFEEQLHYLHDTGYQSIELEEWRYTVHNRKPLSGRKVLITFDYGCRDFLVYAWPLLRHYGFTATLFLVTDQIGRSDIRDLTYGGDISPLSWKEIRQLQSEGVTFGSNSVSYPDLTSLSLREALREIGQSRKTLENELGIYIYSFAYPYGKFNRLIEYLVGISGYDFGLSCEPGPCTMNHSLLALPRIEVKGSDNLEKFVAKLESLTTREKKSVMSSVSNVR